MVRRLYVCMFVTGNMSHTTISPNTDLLVLLAADMTLRRVASTQGGEYAGPCPFCGGRDRFRVWPQTGRYWCRRCQRSGDAIQYVRERHQLGFAEALAFLNLPDPRVNMGRPSTHPPHQTTPIGVNMASKSRQSASKTTKSAAKDVNMVHAAPLLPPADDWQAHGFTFLFECQQALWSAEGKSALAWLRKRGFSDETIRSAQLGYNHRDLRQDRSLWGLPPQQDDQGRPQQVWLPRGVVIPWEIGGQLWRLNIRRPLSPQEIARGQSKYIGPPGSSNGLFGADSLTPGRPAVLLEGELDALSVVQAVGDLAGVAATGSTSGARRTRWIAQLALASTVLVAFDSDDAGEEAAAFWINLLPNARRWRPFWDDANAMAQDGVDLRAWITAGLER